MIGTYLTLALTLGCGYSDTVYDHVVATLQEKSVGQVLRPGSQGEGHRRIYLYQDGSWFLTFEYLYFGDSSKDVTCLIHRGPDETFREALNFVASELPSANIGEPAPRPVLNP